MLPHIVDIVFQAFTIMLFARILASWLPQLQGHRAMQFVSFYTDPYLNLFRKIIPPLGMIDISPVFAFLALSLMKTLILRFIA